MLLKSMSFLYIVLFVTIWCQDDALVIYLWIMKKKRFFCSHQKCYPFFVSKFQKFIMLFKLVLHRRALSTNKQTGTQHDPNMTVRKSKPAPRQGNHGSYVSCKKTKVFQSPKVIDTVGMFKKHQKAIRLPSWHSKTKIKIQKWSDINKKPGYHSHI